MPERTVKKQTIGRREGSSAKTRRLYLIPILSKAIDILEYLQGENRPLTLEAVHQRTGVSKTTVYRVLKTFVHRGYLAQAPDGTYRHLPRARKLRIGFAGQSADMPFSNDVERSLREAALSSGVDLMVLDNHYDGATAVSNAERFIRDNVNLIIEFNVVHQVAPVIGHRVAAAGIPIIAVDIPHPNSVFFGVDNYRVGMEAGELLTAHATEQWGGDVRWMLGLDLPEAGTLVQGRVSGAFEAVRAAFPSLPAERYLHLDGRGQAQRSCEVVAAFLDSHPREKHILIAAATDSSALGAVEAARKRRRTAHVAIVGQDCIADAVAEMQRPGSPMIGTISHETASYGPQLIQIALNLLKGNAVPPYNYVAHRVISRASVLGNAKSKP